MKEYFLVILVVLVGSFWVKRLASLLYDNEKYTQALNRKFSYDEVLNEPEKKREDEEKTEDSTF